MKKTELVSSIAETHAMTKIKAGEVLDHILAEIVRGSADDGGLSIAGFGTFKVKVRPARTGRNPATGESIAVAEKRALSFKPSSGLKI